MYYYNLEETGITKEEAELIFENCEKAELKLRVNNALIIANQKTASRETHNSSCADWIE